MAAWNARNFLIQVTLLRELVPSFDAYPFNIPAIGGLTELTFEQAGHVPGRRERGGEVHAD